MKNCKYIILVLILVAIGIFLSKSPKSAYAPVDKGIDLSPNVKAEQLCYIWNTEAGDKAKLSVDIRNENVIGEFYFLPAEKDSKVGIFTGTISPLDVKTNSRTINSFWEAKAEGTQVKEEFKILLEDSIAKPGFGEMKDRGDGVYLYANPKNIFFGPNLQQADCGDKAMD